MRNIMEDEIGQLLLMKMDRNDISTITVFYDGYKGNLNIVGADIVEPSGETSKPDPVVDMLSRKMAERLIEAYLPKFYEEGGRGVLTLVQEDGQWNYSRSAIDHEQDVLDVIEEHKELPLNLKGDRVLQRILEESDINQVVVSYQVNEDGMMFSRIEADGIPVGKPALQSLIKTWAKEKLQSELDEPKVNESLSAMLTLEKNPNDGWVCHGDFVSKTLIDTLSGNFSLEEDSRSSSPSF